MQNNWLEVSSLWICEYSGLLSAPCFMYMYWILGTNEDLSVKYCGHISWCLVRYSACRLTHMYKFLQYKQYCGKYWIYKKLTAWHRIWYSTTFPFRFHWLHDQRDVRKRVTSNRVTLATEWLELIQTEPVRGWVLQYHSVLLWAFSCVTQSNVAGFPD